MVVLDLGLQHCSCDYVRGLPLWTDNFTYQITFVSTSMQRINIPVKRTRRYFRLPGEIISETIEMTGAFSFLVSFTKARGVVNPNGGDGGIRFGIPHNWAGTIGMAGFRFSS